MDGLIKQLLDSTQADEWLKQQGLGWIIGEDVLGVVGILLSAALVYYVGRFLIVKGIQHLIRSTAKHRSWHRKDVEKREKTLIALVRSCWAIIMVAYVLAMIASQVFKIDLSPLFASAGIIGVALGFGSQSLVKDFLTGVFIIAENQYRVGDVVDIMGSVGTVERVGTRSTVVRDADGNVHYIPNGTIQVVINKTMGYSMSRFSIQVVPETDIDKVAGIIDKVGAKLASEPDWKKRIIEPPHFVAVGEITGRSVELTIASKTMPSDQWAVTSEMRTRLLKAFESHNIELAVLPTPTISRK